MATPRVQCQICGGRLIADVPHVHIIPCAVCGRRPIWCQCGGRDQRGDGTSRAFTNEGEEVFLLSIMTICPIARAAEARQISAEFLQTLGAEAVAEDMLPVQCRPIGGGPVSHVCCERFVYTDEARDQVAWIGASGFAWASGILYGLTDDVVLMKSMFVSIESNEGDSVLAYLGLEEVP